MDNVHGKKRQYFTYKCPDCEMSFNVKGHLVRHIKMGLHAQQENYPDVKEDPTVKGQLISECLLIVIDFPKNQRKI